MGNFVERKTISQFITDYNVDLPIEIVGEILELGALHSIHARDIPSFERYCAQLSTYYMDLASALPPSPRHLLMRALHLLSLLTQNRIAEFHAALELIPLEDRSNVYIQHAIQLEQALMEGSYNRVWQTRHSMPAPECAIFLDMLVGAIRTEIAACIERSYRRLPLQELAHLMFFQTRDEALAFAKGKDDWELDTAGDTIAFVNSQARDSALDASGVMKNILTYARDLERIV
jgi:26S proteasome regulatory subunit N12